MVINYKDYGVEFAVKSKVLRAFGRCAVCGAVNGSPRNDHRVVLTVHHLDEDINNNDLENLMPLCQACHLGQHRGEERRAIYASAAYGAWIRVLKQFAEYLQRGSDK